MTGPGPQAEAWRPCPGFAEHYAVSSFGRVMRVKAGPGTRVGRILQSTPNGHGYCTVSLFKLGKRHTCAVHRLVGTAFVLNEAGPGAHCHHRDSNKQNNASRNLQWLTFAKHQQTIESNSGERHWKAKLTEDAVLDIRLSKLSTITLAKKYNVGKTTIWCVRKGVSWKHVAVPAVDDTMDTVPAAA
jgi:NUMOD4 motif